MNGVFKFKENLFLRYKKEITLTVGAVLTLAAVVKFVPGEAPTSVTPGVEELTTAPVIVEEVIDTNGFTVLLDGAPIGILKSQDDGQAALSRALELVIETLGYNPEEAPELVYDDNFSLDETYLDMETLAETLKEYVIANLDQVKVKAYVMKIGDDFTVAMNSQEEITEVLKNAQSIYINSEDIILDISLACDDHNSMVMIPEVTMVKEDAASVTRTFTANNGDESSEVEGGVVEEEEEEEKDVRKDGETMTVDFAEEVIIVESYVLPDEIRDIEEATNDITKEKDEPKVYKIKSGDVPSIIAESNEMTTSELYNLNPGLKENATRMQIGDKLVVMVPEPELSVGTTEQLRYTETIYKGTTYVDNPSKYKGSESTVDNGYNGIMEIIATVSKVNGDEVDRAITDKTVIKEPKDRVVSKGSKPLPPKGATGNYIAPLSEYRVTSPFGYRWGGFHYGIDLAAPSGTPVMAADGGTVTIAGWYGNYGYLVEIDHGGGVRTRYGHNSKINVSVGQTVSQYQVISLCGNTGRSTGPHVHFEIRFDGVCANPVNYVSIK